MDDSKGGCLIFVIIFALATGLGYLIASHILIDRKPTAMDVYQGKTTLEYTISDGIKTDSVVIFKNKDEKTKNDRIDSRNNKSS